MCCWAKKYYIWGGCLSSCFFDRRIEVQIKFGNDIAVAPNLLYESYPLPAFGGTPPILRGERHSERNQPLIPSKHNGKIFV